MPDIDSVSTGWRAQYPACRRVSKSSADSFQHLFFIQIETNFEHPGQVSAPHDLENLTDFARKSLKIKWCSTNNTWAKFILKIRKQFPQHRKEVLTWSDSKTLKLFNILVQFFYLSRLKYSCQCREKVYIFRPRIPRFSVTCRNVWNCLPYTVVVTPLLFFFSFFFPSSLVLSFRHVLFAPGDKQTQPVHSLTAHQINSQPKNSNCEHVADMWPGSHHLFLLLLHHHPSPPRTFWGLDQCRPGCWTYGSHNIPAGPLTGVSGSPPALFCQRPRQHIRPIIEVCAVAEEGGTTSIPPRP